MVISEKLIDQACSDLKEKCGGVREDYFGLLYLEQEFRLPREEAINHVAFGGNDYGIDGFYFDLEKRNFYLFQFKFTDSATQFKGSFQRLIDAGIARIFGAERQDSKQNDILLQIRAALLENKNIIEKVYFHFVFMGDPAKAESSMVLDKLREDLENKKYLLDKYFDRPESPVVLVIEYRSAKTRKVGGVSHQKRTNTYNIELKEKLETLGPNNEKLILGFVKLKELYSIYKDMQFRFFERNIRSGLSEAEGVNRTLERAFKKIILDGKDDPGVFLFNHNGVTFSAEKVEKHEGGIKITEPRLLNGAQTITSFARFIEKNIDNPIFKQNQVKLDNLHVVCKVITEAVPEFITTVTINNNRQNPVEPWNLHANDTIQLELQDKFLQDLGVYYERQEKAFEALSDEELDDSGVVERKPIELVKLAKTFLVADGEISNFSQMRRVFEEQKLYEKVFNQERLDSDSRKILLCYKVQYRLNRLKNDILERGPNKYEYMNKARTLLWALICQSMLNDHELGKILEKYGNDMSMSADYVGYLSNLSRNRCAVLINDLVKVKGNEEKLAEGNYEFFRSNASFKACMEFAHKRWRWVIKRLK